MSPILVMQSLHTRAVPMRDRSVWDFCWQSLVNSLDRTIATDGVMTGFHAAFSKKVQDKVDSLLAANDYENIIVSGHSLGGQSLVYLHHQPR